MTHLDIVLSTSKNVELFPTFKYCSTPSRAQIQVKWLGVALLSQIPLYSLLSTLLSTLLHPVAIYSENNS